MLSFPQAGFQHHLCFQDAIKESLITSSTLNPLKAKPWQFSVRHV